MRTLFRVFALVIGILASILGLVINILYSATHDVLRLSGGNVRTTHGWIGLGLIIVGFIGALLAVKFPRVAGVLLAIAGLGLCFVLHWFTIFTSPLFIIAAVMTFVDRPEEPAQAPQSPTTQYAS